MTVSEERFARRCICCLGERLRRFPAVLMPFLAKRIFNHEPVEITKEWGLRDIALGMAYSLCSTLECENCGALFLDYRFSDYELGLLYKDYRGDEYNALRTKFEPEYKSTALRYHGRAQYLDGVEKILSPYLPQNPSVLDWGGDSGVNSPFRYKTNVLHVYDVSGVAACGEAKKIPLEECYKHHYDLVACMQVLEHVSHPIDLLKKITQVMNSNTILYLEVPLEGIFQSKEDGKPRGKHKRHWHEHINFFSPASFVALTRNCGLHVLATQTLNISLGWRTSAVQMLICKLP